MYYNSFVYNMYGLMCNWSDILVIFVISLGLLLINVIGNNRVLLGFMMVVFSINIYIINIGYILIPLLLLLSLLSIVIIIYILVYNNRNPINIDCMGSYSYTLFIIIIINIINPYSRLIIGSEMMTCGYTYINNIEVIGFTSVFESNIQILLLVFVLLLFGILVTRFSSRIMISYNIVYFNIVSFIIMNVFILFVIAVLICYIPIIIRYKSKIYKWSSDIYEVGVGVNMSNSLYHSISNNNLGNYFFYYYVYLFILLDIIINIIIVGYMLSIYSIMYCFIIIIISYTLAIQYSNNNYNVMDIISLGLLFSNDLLLTIILMSAIIIGMSIQKIIDLSNLMWINLYKDGIFIILAYTISDNILLLLGLISFIICNMNSMNNKLLIIHWIFIIINTLYITNNIHNNMIYLIFIIICIDVISVINIIFVQKGEGIWYYFLFQSIITIFIWLSLIIDVPYMVGLFYYYKLGAGIGGYYIPNLYVNIMNYNIRLMIYIGITNIILMYNPILNFSTIDKDELVTYFCFINFLIILCIVYIWISNGYLFLNNWLYVISSSTLFLSSIYYIFISIDFVYYNLYYYVYYFTLTSINIWIIFIITYLLVNPFIYNNRGSN